MKKDSGLVYGFSAYIVWGILPLYWKLLGNVGSVDILFYRIVDFYDDLFSYISKNSAFYSRS